jgi:hypothetical protein
MTFICGIHEGIRRGGLGPHSKNECVRSFDSLEALLTHIRVNHQSPLGHGRRTAKGLKRNPETGKWEPK